MKIRLRYELWEYQSGLGFRRASKAANAHYQGLTEGILRQVFYASSEADATAQYYDLRNFGPFTPGKADSQEPFTRAELETQFADFPEDTALAAQMRPRLNRQDIQVAHPDSEGAKLRRLSGYPVTAISPAPVTALPPAAAEPDQTQPTLDSPSRRRAKGGGVWRALGNLFWLLMVGAVVLGIAALVVTQSQQPPPLDRDIVPVPRERALSPIS